MLEWKEIKGYNKAKKNMAKGYILEGNRVVCIECNKKDVGTYVCNGYIGSSVEDILSHYDDIISYTIRNLQNKIDREVVRWEEILESAKKIE